MDSLMLLWTPFAMSYANYNQKGGISILSMVVLGVLIILILSYFNISLRSVVESPTSKDNINYVSGGTKTLWERYLKDPASYIWNDVWIKIFWRGFINNMERIRDGKPTDYDNAAMKLSVPQSAP